MKRYTVIGLVDVTGFTVDYVTRARDHWHAFEKAAKHFIKTEGGETTTLIACVDARGKTETPCESGSVCSAEDYLGEE